MLSHFKKQNSIKFLSYSCNFSYSIGNSSRNVLSQSLASSNKQPFCFSDCLSPITTVKIKCFFYIYFLRSFWWMSLHSASACKIKFTHIHMYMNTHAHQSDLTSVGLLVFNSEYCIGPLF